MTKQEQIEEIKRDIKKALEFDCSKGKCKTCKHKNEDNCEIPLITDYLIEQGYHKVSEGAVVLTKEELVKTMESGYVYDTTRGNKTNLIEMAREVERKETATNFFKDLIRQANFWGETNMWFNYKTLVTVAKQYGVEVEE